MNSNYFDVLAKFTKKVFKLQVIIQGFKSYREQTVIEPFHKGHNVVGKLSTRISVLILSEFHLNNF